MITINGIQFSEQFINSFKTADEFIESAACKHFVVKRIVTAEALKNYFNKITGNDHKNLQPGSTKNKPVAGGKGGNTRERRSDIGPAGDTAEQGPDE